MGTATFERLPDLSRHHADAMITCRGCSHEATVPWKDLLARFGPRRWSMRLTDAQRALKCSRCGERGQRIVPIPAWQRERG